MEKKKKRRGRPPKKKSNKKKNPVGRPSKITKELIQKIADCVREGNYVETACAIHDIHKDTFYEWLKKGNRTSSGLYKEFADAIKRAEAESEKFLLDTMAEIARIEGNWHAFAWRLERRFSNRWGRRDRLKVHEASEGESFEDVEHEKLVDIAKKLGNEA